MDHIQLPCCQAFSHHVICIYGESSCPNCKIRFDAQTNRFIQDAQAKVCVKLKEKATKDRKREMFRKEIKKKITEIVLNRIEKKLNKTTTNQTMTQNAQKYDMRKNK